MRVCLSLSPPPALSLLIALSPPSLSLSRSFFQQPVCSLVIHCKICVIVIAPHDDQHFLQRMLQEAGEGKKPVIMCPYVVAADSEGGMGYTAASAPDLRTCCFTDWVRVVVACLPREALVTTVVLPAVRPCWSARHTHAVRTCLPAF